MVCFGVSAYAYTEKGNFCNENRRIELYDDGTFQWAIPGGNPAFASGTYDIDGSTIKFIDDKTGDKVYGTYTRGISSRSGGSTSPASITILGVKFTKVR